MCVFGGIRKSEVEVVSYIIYTTDIDLDTRLQLEARLWNRPLRADHLIHAGGGGGGSIFCLISKTKHCFSFVGISFKTFQQTFQHYLLNKG